MLFHKPYVIKGYVKYMDKKENKLQKQFTIRADLFSPH